jgi:dephospho-CoA kinase
LLKIGLTGGIGSGKSTVAKIFEQLNVPVYYADNQAKRIIETDAEVRKEIIQLFGPESFIAEKYNRAYISKIAFQQPSLLQALNAIVHPLTIADAMNWIKQQDAPYVIKEAALIFESGSEKELDAVIGVWSTLPLRVKRVMQRDGIDEVEVMRKINNQMPEEEKMSRCNFTINNNETEMLIPQVLTLHEKLLALSKAD